MARWALDAAGLLLSLLTLLLMLAWADSHLNGNAALNWREVWQHSDGSATVVISDISSTQGGFRIKLRRLWLKSRTDAMIDSRLEWNLTSLLTSGAPIVFLKNPANAGVLARVLERAGVGLNYRFERDDLKLFVVMPYFIPLTLMLPLSVWWVVNVRRRWRIRSRRLAGQCLHCGYDLRGSTEGACPECGAIKASAATSPDSAKLVAPADRTLSSPP
jgi:hypothetical protein